MMINSTYKCDVRSTHLPSFFNGMRFFLICFTAILSLLVYINFMCIMAIFIHAFVPSSMLAEKKLGPLNKLFRNARPICLCLVMSMHALCEKREIE